MHKGILITALLLLLAIFGWAYFRAFIGPKVIVYQDRIAKVWRREPLMGLLKVHSGDRQTLEILGQEFPDVRGLSPFYLTTSNANIAVFACAKDGIDKIGIAYLDRGQVRLIDADHHGFGSLIGSGRAAGEPMTDFIQCQSSNLLVLGMRSDVSQTDISIDLKAGAVIAVDYRPNPTLK
jgi:hypothetical protein